jgi:multidrug efflux pump subunit AcrA (membrane-fusion protein)
MGSFWKRRSGAVLASVGVAVLVGGGVLAVSGNGSAVRVAYTSVKQGDVTATVGAAGTVQSGMIREVAFGTSGTVTKVKVKVGQKVTSGQVLATLDSTLATEQVTAAAASLAAANATTLATASPSASASAKTPSTCPTTRTSPKTTKPKTSVSSPAAVTPKPATHSASPKPTTSCSTKSSGSPSPKSSSPSGGNSAPTTVAQLDSIITKAQVALNQAQRALAGTVITAPIDGTVITVAGDVGTQVSGPGSSGFVTLGDLTELQVKASFSQTDVAKLKIGQTAAISLATRAGQSFDGSVTHIEPAATTTGSLVQYGVNIAFDNVPTGLLLGQTATVLVTVQQAQGTLYVPATALRAGTSGTYQVQVRRAGGTQTRSVQIGVRGDQYVEIRSGLSSGDQVVTSG